MAKTEVAQPAPEEAPQRDLVASPTPEVAQHDLAPQHDLVKPRSLVEVAAPSVVDEFHGQGGSYLLDPATGIRTLVERTKPASL